MDPTTHRRRWWILLVLIVSLFTVNLDNTIVNVALPTLARALGAGMSQLQWIVDSYVLLFAGLLLAAGAIGDRFGRRRVMLVGLALFGVGSAASALAPSAEALIGLRALMGIGGALIVPSTLSVTASVFTMEERPKAIGIWTAVAGLGIVAGPVLAGWLLDHFAWGSVFLINVPVVIVAIAGTLAIVPEGKSPNAARLDVPGVLLSVGGVVALVYGVIQAPADGWTSIGVLATFGVAAALLATFVWRELATPDPLLDVRLLAQPNFGSAVLAVMLTSFGLFGSMFFFSQYLQGVLAFGTMETGFSVLPLAIAIAIASPLGMPLARRVGTRTIVTVGMGAVAVGLMVFRMAGVTDGYVDAAATLVLVGAGMGLAMGPLTVLMVRTLPPTKQGVASAINSTARELGGAMGVAILGSLAAPIYGSDVHTQAQRLPAAAAAAVQDSLAGAGAVAAHLPAVQGTALLALARSAFVDGMGFAVLGGAAVAIVGALVAVAFLPGRGVNPSAAATRVPEAATPATPETVAGV
jgi:EmrB/QacA subfamily drug resistance transporter